MPYKDQKCEAKKAQVMRWHLQTRYGITIEEFDRMFALQSGVCAICHKPEKDNYKRRLSVDHDHNTGKVRGLLCHACNTAIGKFGDNPDRLESAARYLRLYEELN